MEEKFPLGGLALNVVRRFIVSFYFFSSLVFFFFGFLVSKSCVLFENKQAHVDSFLLVEGLVSLLD